MSASLGLPLALALALQASVRAGREPVVAPPGKFSIRWTTSPATPYKTTVEVFGLSTTTLKQLEHLAWQPAQWQRLFPVYAEQGKLVTDVSLPPMIGTYQVASSAVRFQPQFPLDPGLTYRAIFHPDQLPGDHGAPSRLVSAVFTAPARPASPSTVVNHVFPSAEMLPENLLKFYVHFSASMSRGQIYDHIHLRDESGKDIELPFLEIDEELWNPAMTRLTLFIDPGRIKRGVRPLEEVGPALEEGKRMTLVIDEDWKDGAGNPLRESFRKTFKVGPPDREAPDPAQWKIQPPRSNTRETLMVAFPDPMDHALAQRLIRVTNPSGQSLDGKTALADEERGWRFVPTQPWKSGTHQLVIQTTIEDLAGNNIGKPFEVDLVEPVQRQLTRTSVKVPFEVR
ncbi:MAG: Ig-like domain-containing protein [Verrucomicrobiales bacterium]